MATDVKEKTPKQLALERMKRFQKINHANEEQRGAEAHAQATIEAAQETPESPTPENPQWKQTTSELRSRITIGRNRARKRGLELFSSR